MDKTDSFLLGSLTALTIVACIMAVFNLKTDSRPVYVPQETKAVACDDIIRYEDGSLVCEIHFGAEDDNVPVKEI